MTAVSPVDRIHGFCTCFWTNFRSYANCVHARNLFKATLSGRAYGRAQQALCKDSDSKYLCFAAHTVSQLLCFVRVG